MLVPAGVRHQLAYHAVDHTAVDHTALPQRW
jgi:hypothetical protein